MENLLEVKHLKKYFNTKHGTLHAVDDISFTLQAGKTIGVVGESGCGKSTLGRAVIGLNEVTDGQIIFEGRDVTHLSLKERKKMVHDMQIIFQDPFTSLDPRKSVFDLIAEPLKINHMTGSKDELTKRVIELMDTVGLAKRFLYAYPHELDGGRRQRIGVARALALEPKFIVCDEPVSALDVSIQAQILNLLQDLQEQRNIAYMFITHDLSVVRHISDEVMVMYVGTMFEKAEAQELFDHPIHPYTLGLLSAIPVPVVNKNKEKIIMAGEISMPINPPAGCRFAGRCPFATEACHTVTPELEEPFPGHFVACHNMREIHRDHNIVIP
ncbi:MAG: ATP-binding cassette domain-containing protein [Parasporobacterium sp.]|nr:ATP-binding cassette domain-containing protein [Parasporobacterium sp.]